MSLENDESVPHARERLVLWHMANHPDASTAQALALRRRATAALRLAGGELFASIGSGVGASFDPLSLPSVIELCLELLRKAEQEYEGLEASCALALGELAIDDEGGGPIGGAIDRGQVLAACAERFELVLDEAAHARSEASHLFSRFFLCGPAVAGHVIDARHPTRSACRAALGYLQPAPLPPGLRANFEQLVSLARDPGLRRIAIAAPQPYAALDFIERLRSELAPSLVLHLGNQAAGLQPLGGLQLAFRRAHAELAPALDATLLNVVSGFSDGTALMRDEASIALRELLRRARSTGRRAFIVLDRAREIDSASLALVSEAMAEQQDDCLLFMLIDEQGKAPGALLGDSDQRLLTIEPLASAERAFVAEGLLGTDAGSELARRVALLGGDCVLGIVEAARTLICAGDLVHEDGAFRWRTQPRNASLPIPIDALLTERASGLSSAAQRVLEAICVAPSAVPREFVARIGNLDGLADADVASGFAELEQEGWLDRHGGLGALERPTRAAVRNGMPPARAAELHRFVAEVLDAEPALATGPSFGHALLAHHLAEGGREREAAGALLDAAQAATESGFARMAVRLAALALKLDASSDTRQRARQVAGTVDTKPPPRESLTPAAPSAPLELGQKLQTQPDPRRIANTAIEAAISAILRGEYDIAEALIDTAVAAGFARAAAQRLLAITQLWRGDVPEAVRALKQAQLVNANGGARSREKLAAALILLEAGERVEAVRAALEALAAARRSGDVRGERVVLHVLAGCYRALGRPTEAARIAEAAGPFA